MSKSDSANDQYDRAAADLEHLLTAKNTLVLGTLDDQGRPEAGLTPFWYDDGRFYVFISGLASHTRNVRRHPTVSVLIHNGDETTANPFTDKRVSYQAEAQPVEDGNRREAVLDAMTPKLGKTLALLRSLPDFTLYEIVPTSGQLVVGFGAAFEVNVADGTLTWVDGKQQR